MRKRKPRIQCRIEGCRREIIYDRLMCRSCWMTIRAPWRKRHLAIWRELRQFIDRSTNELKLKPGLTRDDLVLVSQLISRHGASCKKMLKLASPGGDRLPSASPGQSPLARELKEMGLI